MPEDPRLHLGFGLGLGVPRREWRRTSPAHLGVPLANGRVGEEATGREAVGGEVRGRGGPEDAVRRPAADELLEAADGREVHAEDRLEGGGSQGAGVTLGASVPESRARNGREELPLVFFRSGFPGKLFAPSRRPGAGESRPANGREGGARGVARREWRAHLVAVDRGAGVRRGRRRGAVPHLGVPRREWRRELGRGGYSRRASVPRREWNGAGTHHRARRVARRPGPRQRRQPRRRRESLRHSLRGAGLPASVNCLPFAGRDSRGQTPTVTPALFLHSRGGTHRRPPGELGLVVGGGPLARRPPSVRESPLYSRGGSRPPSGSPSAGRDSSTGGPPLTLHGLPPFRRR